MQALRIASKNKVLFCDFFIIEEKYLQNIFFIRKFDGDNM